MAPTDRRLFCLFISTLVICCMHRTSTQAQTVRVRLEGGPNSYSGRVVVIRNGIPGTICDDAFGNTDAQVICRMLGFDPSTRIGIRSLSNMYGPGTGRIWVDELGCLGYETSITQCRRNSWGVHDCSHSEDVSITCGTPIAQRLRVLLEGGPNSYSGRVVVIYNGVRGTICDDLFGNTDAQVICRMLGFDPVTRTGIRSLGNRYGRGTGRIWVDNLGCLGNETSITQCRRSRWGVHDCMHSEDVSITCGTPIGPTRVHVTLVNGRDRLHGRISLSVNNVAGSICRTGFDEADARVICRMLGYTGRYLSLQDYGRGTRRIWLANVNCTGNEVRITECDHPGFGSYGCSLRSAVGVNCGPTYVNVTLQNGTNPLSGRVVVSLTNGTMGTVCDDHFGLDDAKVVCSSLGYGNKSAALEYFGPGTGRILMDDVNCTGDETNLGLCSHAGWGYHNCHHGEDVGISCDETNTTVQLVGGPDSLHGRITISRRGEIGTVCGYWFTVENAKVMCRMLGYRGDDITISSYGPGEGRIWIESLRCNGTEDNINECFLYWGTTGFCFHALDVGLNCGPISESVLNISLVGGPDMFHGRVVIQYMARQGTICSTGFDQNDAKVICQMLGYRRRDVSLQSYGPGTGDVLLENVRCQGNESHILFCSHNGIGNSNCSHSLDVGINCGSGPIKVILEGPDANHGRVLLQYQGQLGTICDDSLRFGRSETRLASVICRMNGYRGNDVEAWRYSGGQSTSKTWIGNVICQGNEASIAECDHSGWGLAPCNQSTNLAVNCGAARGSDIQIRTEGFDRLHGRVIVTYQGVEGTICNRGFGTYDARVICWMLGYFGTFTRFRSYGPGRGRILLSDLQCRSDHIHLSSCRHPGWGVTSASCDHDNDVGIDCGPFVLPRNVSTVLEGGMDEFHGRVTFRHGSAKGIICESATTIGLTQSRLAVVLCRMAGYSGSDVQFWHYTAEGTSEIWFSNMRCIGNETSIADCTRARFYTSCDHTRAVGVSCGIRISDVKVYLVNGPDIYHGHVVVNYYGINGTICDDGFGLYDARVICWMAGYYGSDVRVTRQYGRGTGVIWLDALACSGTENHVERCVHRGWGNYRLCSHYEDVGVECGPIKTENIDVQLVGGSGPFDGRVAVQNNNVSGAICSTGFDQNAARVICRMLGYRGLNISIYQYNADTNHIWLENLHCTGRETHLAYCGSTGWGNKICPAGKVVGISCGIQNDTRSTNRSRVIDGCGVRFTSNLRSKIYGGRSATQPWPWMVSLQFTSNHTHNCGGTIIAPRWILTAGHCVRSPFPSTYKIVAGTRVISRTGRTLAGLTLRISKIIVHPDFIWVRRSLNLLLTHDIALIQLQEELNYTSVIRPICLSPRMAVPTGPCYLTGWGYTMATYSYSGRLRNVRRPTQLQEAVYPIRRGTSCARQYTYFDDSLTLCAGYISGSRDLCAGDSGGPVVCQRPGTNTYDQYGIASYGKRNCGRDTYSVLTNVLTFKDWINEEMAKNP